MTGVIVVVLVVLEVLEMLMLVALVLVVAAEITGGILHISFRKQTSLLV